MIARGQEAEKLILLQGKVKRTSDWKTLRKGWDRDPRRYR
jgi:hypothetical protein